MDHIVLREHLAVSLDTRFKLRRLNLVKYSENASSSEIRQLFTFLDSLNLANLEETFNFNLNIMSWCEAETSIVES